MTLSDPIDHAAAALHRALCQSSKMERALDQAYAGGVDLQDVMRRAAAAAVDSYRLSLNLPVRPR